MNGHRSSRRVVRCAGFTLVELMVAGALTLVLSASVLSLLFQSQSIAETMLSRIRFNAEAREAFFTIANGRRLDRNGDGVWENVALGHRANESGTYTLFANRLKVDSDVLGSKSGAKVLCSAAGEPHPDCVPPERMAVGFLYQMEIGNVADRTVTLKLDFADPYYMVKNDHYSEDDPEGRSLEDIPREQRERYLARFMQQID